MSRVTGEPILSNLKIGSPMKMKMKESQDIHKAVTRDRTHHFSHILAEHEFSFGSHLFTFSISGLLYGQGRPS